MTWAEEAWAIIGEIDKTLPADISPRDRRSAIRKAKPWWFAQTSHGRKVWSRVTSEYMRRHGEKPRGKDIPGPLL